MNFQLLSMGERSFIKLQLLRKVYPIRRIIIAASAVFVFLSFLIVLESAFILSANNHGSPFLVIFSYVLAWLLVAIGLFGLKIGILSHNIGNRRNSSRPGSAPVWIPSSEPDPELLGFSLPGAVQTTTVEVLYPPPPPRYSSLSHSATVPRSPILIPSCVQESSRPATTPVSSPPPPYPIRQ